jgi:hypothetical protein
MKPSGFSRLQQTDHPIVMQLQAGDAALSNQRGLGQCGKLACIDGTGQQLGAQDAIGVLVAADVLLGE